MWGGSALSERSLEAEFDAACEAGVNECKRLGYNPTVWIAMKREMGAVRAARKLLESGDIQSGFERLVSQGRTDLTIEFAALNPKWDTIFERQHREAAWWRLDRASRGEL